MDIRQLRYFHQIVTSGSLSRAAEALSIAQPALSLHLKNLEREFDTALVVRHPRGVELTDAGRVLFEQAKLILQEVDQTHALIQELSARPRGTVRFGLPTSVVRGLTPPLIAETRRRFPDVSLHVVEGMSGALCDALAVGDLDLALLFETTPTRAVLVEPLVRERLFCVVGRAHPLANRDRIPFRDLRRYEIALPSARHTLRRIVDRAAEEEGIPFTASMDIDSMQGLLAAAKAGTATIIPRFCAMEEIASGDLTAVEIFNPALEWRLLTVCSMRGGLSSAGVAVNAALKTITRDLVRTGAWPATLQ